MHIIYETTNLVNGKKYIGVHRVTGSNSYFGSGIILKYAIKKYGKENFERDTLIIVATLDEALYYEGKLVTQEVVDNPNFYNIALGGNAVRLGKHHSNETKKKLREINLGYKHSAEAKKRMRVTRKKNPMKFSAETRRLISESKLGAKHPLARSVICIETLKEYSTLIGAALDVGLKGSSSILAVCKGKGHTAAGYHWKYKDIS